jgi:UDP-N-acetylglucosamine acyltransferase
MPLRHPTAVIDPGAEIAADAQIGPYCIVGPHAVIGTGVRMIAHVHVTGHTTIGARTVIAPFCSLGTPPQSVKYRGGPTRLVIGADCDLREAVTMNTGTEDDRAVTEVGDRCLFMVNAHVGHDCRVGNDVIFANNVALGGHVNVGDSVMIGGQSAVHQFVRIGEGAMIAGVTGVASDVIPFGFAIGQRAYLKGLNVVGLRRRGIGRSDLQRLRRAYQVLFLGEGQIRDRLDAVEREFAGAAIVGRIVAFIRDGGRRPLAMPQGRGPAADADGDPS